jgi:hypothetical protein
VQPQFPQTFYLENTLLVEMATKFALQDGLPEMVFGKTKVLQGALGQLRHLQEDPKPREPKPAPHVRVILATCSLQS